MPDAGGVRAGIGVRAVFILIGFTAAMAQIVLLRELMVVFLGNEISIGLMLASWLLWTAVGSSLAGRWAVPVPVLQALIAAALPSTVLAVRAAKGLLQTVPGEVLGPGPMLLASLVALAPLCALSGALFTAGTRLCSSDAGEAAGSVYLWEAVGSSAGGLVAGLVLVRYWGSLEIACLLAVLNLAAACSLMPRVRAVAGAVVGIALLLAIFGAPRKWEASSEKRFWNGQKLLAARNSLYGNLAVVEVEGSRSMYENGVVLFNVPDPAAAEEAVHYALLEHPSPHSLLLIGGGMNGSIAQALRHPSMQRVDYVELDPAILDVARDYFPDEWRTLQRDPRVHVHVMDGRLFLKTTHATFDVVITNLPDPRNAQLNRFFTVEFFREVSRQLTPTGLLSFQLSSSENYISPELGQFLRSIDKSLREVFPCVTAIPGETIHFFAANQPGILAANSEELLARLHARHLAASYVSDSFIPFRMTPDRLSEMNAQIQPRPETPVNRDFAPVAYYFDVALWSSQFNRGYARFFRALAAVRFSTLMTGLAILLAALVLLGRRRQVAAGFCTAATGFTVIGLEMLLLLAFQAVYGYVYQELAMIIAAFMAGMALGSWLAMRYAMRGGMRLLAVTQVLIAAAPLALLSSFAFPAMATIFGMLGGFEFPLASRIFFQRANHRRGTLYALDLAGSSLGAILFSVWLIPVFGFFRTALLSAMVSLAPAVMAILAAE